MNVSKEIVCILRQKEDLQFIYDKSADCTTIEIRGSECWSTSGGWEGKDNTGGVGTDQLG